MWICQRCHTENHDAYSACEACGAARSAGRFGAPAQQAAYRGAQPPRVSAPAAMPAPERDSAAAPTVITRSRRNPPGDAPVPRPRTPFLFALARFIGTALTVLLPLLAATLAWRQQETLRTAVVSLWVGPNAPSWLEWVCFGALALSGLLLSLLPGLWTLLSARKNGKR